MNSELGISAHVQYPERNELRNIIVMPATTQNLHISKLLSIYELVHCDKFFRLIMHYLEECNPNKWHIWHGVALLEQEFETPSHCFAELISS